MPEDGSSDPASVSSSEPASQSWIGKHSGAVITSFIAGVLVLAIGLWWAHTHPPLKKADVVAVNWTLTNDTSTKLATVSLRVHNDGNGSVDGCNAHWVALDSSGAESSELAVSQPFGIAAGATVPEGGFMTLTRKRGMFENGDFSARLPTEVRTVIYVKCGADRYANSVTKSALIAIP